MSFFIALQLKRVSLKTRDFEKWEMQVQGPFWAQAALPGPVFLPLSLPTNSLVSVYQDHF